MKNILENQYMKNLVLYILRLPSHERCFWGLKAPHLSFIKKYLGAARRRRKSAHHFYMEVGATFTQMGRQCSCLEKHTILKSNPNSII